MSHDRLIVRKLVSIEWLNPVNIDQVDQVVQIDRLTNSKPRNEDELHWMLRHGHLCRIALVGRFVAGFLLYEASRGGRRIASIAVEPSVQRQGIGSMLIDSLKRQMENVPRLTEIVAHVPESQLPVQQFLRANKFRWTRTIPGRSDEGTYVMSFDKSFMAGELAATGEPAGQSRETEHLRR